MSRCQRRSGFDPKSFPLLRLIRGKSAVLSMHVRTIAARHGCLLADLWSMRVLSDLRLWEPDRLHLAPDGHRRVALLACETAGVPVSEDWRAPLTAASARAGRLGDAATWLAARWNDIEWLTEHVAPYLSRRLHGVSAGDGMTAKRAELATLDPSIRSGAMAEAGLGASPAAEPLAVESLAVE